MVIEQIGSLKATEGFLSNALHLATEPILRKYGEQGVKALAAATPKDTGYTASAWHYEVSKSDYGIWSLEFYNDNINNGIPIALLLQLGHATRNGGWVEGIDYINPALKPVFDELAIALFEEVFEKDDKIFNDPVGVVKEVLRL